MRIAFWILLLAASAWGADAYGGKTDRPCAGGPSEHFYREKIGSQWHICTPGGNSFKIQGVYYLVGNSWVDEMGSSFDTRTASKYGSDPVVQMEKQLLRLKAWGFNSLGPGAYNRAESWYQPTTKLPSVSGYVNPGISCVANASVKNVLLNHSLSDLNAGNFPDVFDPAFASCSDSLFATEAALSGGWIANAGAYSIGYMGEDTDYLSGFGAGTDYSTIPAGKQSIHLGLAILVHPSAGFASKGQLVTFLTAKYATIDALNTAWGSSYTTWGTNGGYGVGTGFLDESGTLNHAWLGSPVDIWSLSGADADVKADLDDFLYEVAKKYFQVTKDSFNAVMPGVMYFGPTAVGSWHAPARCPVLKAAGEMLDVVNIGGSDWSQEQIDFIVECAGDVPLASWIGMTANPDSGRYRYTPEESPYAVTTQEARGELLLNEITKMYAATHNGVKPFVGYLFWQFLDNSSEQANWGLVSFADNAYDGLEATTGTKSCAAPLAAYTCLAEESNYGDFISSVKAANALWLDAPGSMKGNAWGRGKVKIQ